MIEYKDIKKDDYVAISLDGYHTKTIGKVLDKLTGDLGTQLVIIRSKENNTIQIIDWNEWNVHYVIER